MASHDNVRRGFEETEENAKRAYGRAGDNVSQGAEDAKHMSQDVYNRAADTAKDVGQAGQEHFDTTADYSGFGLQQAKKNTADASEAVKANTASAWEGTKARTAEASQYAEDTAQQAKEKSVQATQYGADVAHQATVKVGEGGQTTMNAVSQLGQNAFDTAGEVVGGAQYATTVVAGGLFDTVKFVGQKLTDVGQGAREATGIDKKPSKGA